MKENTKININKLMELTPVIDPLKVEAHEVILFFAIFIKSKILSVNTYVNWDENQHDKSLILYLLDLALQYNNKEISFDKLREAKKIVKDKEGCRGVNNLHKVWRAVWPFTFDFLNDENENSLDLYLNLFDYVSAISPVIWEEFITSANNTFKGRLEE